MPTLQSDDSARMMSEWLVCVMTRYIYVAFAVVDPGPSDPKMKVFQVLSVKPKQALVKVFDDASPIRYGLRATVQPLEVWRGSELNADSTEMSCVAVSGPQDVDLLKLCSSDTEHRELLLQVFQTDSDLEGCICLSNFSPLVPSCALHDDNIPVICLLDELILNDFDND